LALRNHITNAIPLGAMTSMQRAWQECRLTIGREADRFTDDVLRCCALQRSPGNGTRSQVPSRTATGS
jgi:hypothetical protein